MSYHARSQGWNILETPSVSSELALRDGGENPHPISAMEGAMGEIAIGLISGRPTSIPAQPHFISASEETWIPRQRMVCTEGRVETGVS